MCKEVTLRSISAYKDQVVAPPSSEASLFKAKSKQRALPFITPFVPSEPENLQSAREIT